MTTGQKIALIVACGATLAGVAAALRVVTQRNAEREAQEAALDEMSAQSFPASDPPSLTPITGPRT